MRPVDQLRGRDFSGIVLLLVELIALCWPTILNRGQPLVFPDTRSYYVAGRAAISKAIDMLHYSAGTEVAGVGPVAGESLDSAIQKARAVRSVFYSAVTYLSAATGSLWLAISLQAIVVAIVLHLVFDLLCPDQPRNRVTWFMVSLALTTPVSWVVSTAMPDVYTPIAVLGTIVAIQFWYQLRLRWLLFITIVISTVMHLTNPPIILATMAVGAVLHRSRLRNDWPRFAMVGAAVVVALSVTLMVSVVGFKQWTLTPNQPPFLLARSIDDGPGKLYLREHCPQVNLVMCRHLDRLDVGSDDFIWHENGVYSSVSLAEAAALRAEDKHIFIAAALEHPWMQLKASARNMAWQLATFDLSEFFIPSDGYAESFSAPDLTSYIRPTEPTWQKLLAIPEYLVVLVSVVYLMYLYCRGLLPADQRDFLVLILSAVVIDALPQERFRFHRLATRRV